MMTLLVNDLKLSRPQRNKLLDTTLGGLFLFIGAHQADRNVFSSQVKNEIFARIGRGQLAETRARGFEIRDQFKATRDSHESPR
jgi:hypothetical protein